MVRLLLQVACLLLTGRWAWRLGLRLCPTLAAQSNRASMHSCYFMPCQVSFCLLRCAGSVAGRVQCRTFSSSRQSCMSTAAAHSPHVHQPAWPVVSGWTRWLHPLYLPQQGRRAAGNTGGGRVHVNVLWAGDTDCALVRLLCNWLEA